MSLLGKILAILNLLCLVALVFLGLSNYGVRQKLSHGLFVADLMLHGLPVDKTELDATGLPIAERITPQTLQEVLGAASGPRSQHEEAIAAAKKYRAAVAGQADAVAKRNFLAWAARAEVTQVNEWEDLVRLLGANNPRDAASFALGYLGRPVFGYHRLPTGYLRRDRLQGLIGESPEGALAGSGDYIPSSRFLADPKVLETLAQLPSAADVAVWALLARLDLVFDAAGVVLGDPASASQNAEKAAAEPAEDGSARSLDIPQRKAAISQLLWAVRTQGEGADPVAELSRMGAILGPQELHNTLEEEARAQRVMQQEVELRLQKARGRFVIAYQGRVDELGRLSRELNRLKVEVAAVKALSAQQPELIAERQKSLTQLKDDLSDKQVKAREQFQQMQQNALALYEQRRTLMGLLDQVGKVEKELRELEASSQR